MSGGREGLAADRDRGGHRGSVFGPAGDLARRKSWPAGRGRFAGRAAGGYHHGHGANRDDVGCPSPLPFRAGSGAPRSRSRGSAGRRRAGRDLPGERFAARGLVGLVVTVGVAGLVGVAAARFLGVNAGLGAMAMTLIAPAMRLGELVPILRWAEPGAFRALAFEGLLLALLAAAVAVLLERASHARAHGSGDARPRVCCRSIRRSRWACARRGRGGGVGDRARADEGRDFRAWPRARRAVAARLVAIRASIASIALGVMLVARWADPGDDARRGRRARAREQRLPALRTRSRSTGSPARCSVAPRADLGGFGHRERAEGPARGSPDPGRSDRAPVRGRAAGNPAARCGRNHAGPEVGRRAARPMIRR